MISTAHWSLPEEVFSTDACLMGCGGICASQYFHAEFPYFVLSQDLDINCLELLTIDCGCSQAVGSPLAWASFDNSL